MSKKYSSCQISLFDNFPDAEKSLNNESYDIVLFGETFSDISIPENILNNTAFSYISSKDEIINGTDTIYKYTSISGIYEKLCGIYEKKQNRVIRTHTDEPESEDVKTEIITFLPVHGGAGSSTMAAACAIMFAADESVLYINLEQCPGNSAFFDNGTKKGITDILSVLKTKYTPKIIHQLLEEVIKPDTIQSYSKVSCINGYNNVMDCTAVNEQSIETFLTILKNEFKYRYIIIDTDYIINPTMKKLILLSDKLVFTSSGSDIANIKFSKLQRYLEVLKRENSEMPENFMILNQYYGAQNEAECSGGIHIIKRFSRYRLEGNIRITSQNVINQILKDTDAFSDLK